MKSLLTTSFVLIHIIVCAQLPKVWPFTSQLYTISVKFEERAQNFYFPDSTIKANKVSSAQYSIRKGLIFECYFDSTGRIIEEKYFRKNFLKKTLTDRAISEYTFVDSILTIKKIRMEPNGDTNSVSKQVWNSKQLVSDSFIYLKGSLRSDLFLSASK